MGMKVQFKSYNSTRDINEDMNSSNVTQFYNQKSLPNGQFYNDFIPRTSIESYPVYASKDVLRQKMLEHESVFRDQVYELHRLYRIQRDLMEEVRRNGSYKHQISMEGSSSSNRLPYQNPPEDSRKWNLPSVPLLNPGSSRPSNLGGDVIINSPLSCTNGTSQVQNDSTLKDLESSRPSKVRKKLFDLQLPADEYIDDSEDGEQVQENNPNNNHTKLFLGGKNEFREDTLKQDTLRARGSVKLADLNEPLQIEPANGVDLLGRPVIPQIHKTPFLSLPREFVNGNNNLSVETKGNGRGWLSYVHEAGSSRSNPNPFPQCIQPEMQPMNSHQVQFTPNAIPYYNHQLQPVGIFSRDNISRVDLWGEQKGRVLEIPNRIQERCNYGNNLESVLGSSSSSRMPSSYPFLNPPELPNSWPHSALPWGNLNNPMNSYNQKLMPVQMHPSFNSNISRNSQPLDQTQADNWQVTRMMNTPMLPSEQISIRNGFYQGSSVSGPKQLSAAPGSSDYMNRSYKGSNFVESTSTKGMNLNAFPPSSCNEVVVRKDTQRTGEKLVNSQDQHLQVLPWLRAKPIVKTEPVTNIMDLNYPNQIYDVGVGAKDEKKIMGFPIFGIPRPSGNHYPFVLPTTNTSASTARFSPELEDSKSNVKRILIDINVACEDDTAVLDSAEPPAFVDKGKGSLKPENRKNFIDLNLCASDDEGDQQTLSDAIAITKSKVRVEIDLEAYPSDVGSDEEQENQPEAKHKEAAQHQEQEEQVEGESIRAAAEAIMAISSAPNVLSEDSILDPFESAMADSLLLLFDTISVSETSNLVKKTNLAVEIDYYELMTLQLPETKEEDYMPHYSITNFLETDEAGLSFSPNRPRRGQARRGRPRRDFQRDILPGLISLSRHQITDDLQTFGGLMRGTGHNWPAGSSRRGGGRGGGAPRGRRRAVAVAEPIPPPATVVAMEETPESPPVIPPASLPAVQTIEVGLKDTNLTGWGKTTRRPRRQRCSAGNAIAVALT
jgi:hypothetical protein